jgi:hypothetical protein
MNRLATVTICSLATAGAARGASWDFNAQFGWTDNPNGAWTYGTYEGAAFQPFTQPNGTALTPGWTSPSTAGMWKNLGGPQFGALTGQVSLHPGSGHQATAARWTAPRGGRAEVTGQFFAGDQAVLDYAVWHNAVERFHVRSGGTEPFDLVRVVAPGDRIDFLVYGGYAFGNTPLDAFVTLFISGDANRDGTVNLADFNTLAGNFGQTQRDWSTGDFNDDTIVNLEDFNLLAGNFGQSAAGPGVTPDDWAALAAAIPEPGAAAAGLLGGAGILLRGRRRRR